MLDMTDYKVHIGHYHKSSALTPCNKCEVIYLKTEQEQSNTKHETSIKHQTDRYNLIQRSAG